MEADNYVSLVVGAVLVGALSFIYHRIWTTGRLVDRLFEMHDKQDDDGVYVWYVRQSLTEAIREMSNSNLKMSASIEVLSEVLRQIHEEQREIKRRLSEITHGA